MAMAGVIFGVISVIAFYGLPGIITAIIGLFLSIRARGEASSNQKYVRIGIGLNSFFLVIGVIGEILHVTNK